MSLLTADDYRLVGGASSCAGRLEMKRGGEWEPADDEHFDRNLTAADVVCRQLDCGPVVSIRRTKDSRSISDTISGFVKFSSVFDKGSPVLEISCSGQCHY